MPYPASPSPLAASLSPAAWAFRVEDAHGTSGFRDDETPVAGGIVHDEGAAVDKRADLAQLRFKTHALLNVLRREGV